MASIATEIAFLVLQIAMVFFCLAIGIALYGFAHGGAPAGPAAEDKSAGEEGREEDGGEHADEGENGAEDTGRTKAAFEEGIITVFAKIKGPLGWLLFFVTVYLFGCGWLCGVGMDEEEEREEEEGEEEDEEDVAKYRDLTTSRLMIVCFKEVLAVALGRMKRKLGRLLFFVIVYLLGWGWVFRGAAEAAEGEDEGEVEDEEEDDEEEEGEEEEDGEEEEGEEDEQEEEEDEEEEEEEGEEEEEEEDEEEEDEMDEDEEVEEEFTAWDVLKERMAEWKAMKLARLHEGLDWWRYQGPGFGFPFYLVCSLLGLWLLVQSISYLQSVMDGGTGIETVPLEEMPVVIPVHYGYDGALAAADPAAIIIATRIGPYVAVPWDTPFVGTLGAPAYGGRLESEEEEAWETAMPLMNTEMDGQLPTNPSIVVELCSLLIRHCGTQPDAWKSCRLDLITSDAQILERCMSFAVRSVRHSALELTRRAVGRVLRISADPPTPSPIPPKTSTKGIESAEAPVVPPITSPRLSIFTMSISTISTSTISTTSTTAVTTSVRASESRKTPPHRSLLPGETYEYCKQCKQWHVFDDTMEREA